MELREELKSLAEEKGIKAGMAKKKQSENKSDTPPETNAALSHAVPVLQRLVDGMKPVDLVKTLMEKIGDPLERYRDADGTSRPRKSLKSSGSSPWSTRSWRRPRIWTWRFVYGTGRYTATAPPTGRRSGTTK